MTHCEAKISLMRQLTLMRQSTRCRVGIRNARQPVPTVGDWVSLSHEKNRAHFHAEAGQRTREAAVGTRTRERTNPNVITIVGMVCFFTMMLLVGFVGDRLMW